MKPKAIIIFVITVFILQIQYKTEAQSLIWKDGFLEKKYNYQSEIISQAIDSLFSNRCVAYSRETIEDGIILGNGVGDKNGKWKNWSNVCTIKGINIKEGGMLIYYKWVDKKDGIVIGFKTEDNDKNIPSVLHKLFLEKILAINKSALKK